MKLFGYEVANDDGRLIRLTEVSLQATPGELRRIAAFLERTASLQEESGAGFGHEHLSGYAPGIDWGVDLIVAGKGSPGSGSA